MDNLITYNKLIDGHIKETLKLHKNFKTKQTFFNSNVKPDMACGRTVVDEFVNKCLQQIRASCADGAGLHRLFNARIHSH